MHEIEIKLKQPFVQFGLQCRPVLYYNFTLQFGLNKNLLIGFMVLIGLNTKCLLFFSHVSVCNVLILDCLCRCLI